MKILIAPDSFKESLTAGEVASAIASGIRAFDSTIECIKIPVADGGEGTLDTILQATAGERRIVEVQDPLGNNVSAALGLVDGGRLAVIEMAQASGLHHVPLKQRNPFLTSTFGTGQLIKYALDNAVEQICLTLGGSATNDAGVGMLTALGARFLNNSDQPLAPGGIQLAHLHHIDLSKLDSRLRQVTFKAACDVDNPLCGPRGASMVFGPQKGATRTMAEQLDQALALFGSQLQVICDKSVMTLPGAGAAGGMGATCHAVFDAQLLPGIDMVLEVINFKHQLQGADLVITGEGRIDQQTMHGKAPQGVFKLAQASGIPVIAIGGCLGEGWEGLLQEGVQKVYSAMPAGMEVAEAIVKAQDNLTRISARAIADWVAH